MHWFLYLQLLSKSSDSLTVPSAALKKQKLLEAIVVLLSICSKRMNSYGSRGLCMGFCVGFSFH